MKLRSSAPPADVPFCVTVKKETIDKDVFSKRWENNNRLFNIKSPNNTDFSTFFGNQRVESWYNIYGCRNIFTSGPLAQQLVHSVEALLGPFYILEI
jgi:hypothetical protein